jgi:murein DD-endopeptidase MepM/ murein hydrolase activator NlpD
MGEYTDFISKIKGAEFRGVNFIEYQDEGGEPYISFQTLLYFLDEYINIGSKGKSIVSIDWESDKPFYTFSSVFSSNLKICYVYNSNINLSDGSLSANGVATFQKFDVFKEDKFKKLNATLKKESTVPDGTTALYPQIGNINYIYLNLGYLSNLIIKDKTDSENKITFSKFLQTICDDINKSLGGLNDFKVITDPDENNITIVDYNQKRIKGLAPSENELSTLKVQGLGSFVTSVSAQSSITPQIASMISIGAQANGNQVGDEATSFSKLNYGIIDRVYPEKGRKGNENPKVTKDENNGFESTIEAYKTLIGYLQKKDKDTSGQIILKSDDKSDPSNIAVDLYKTCLGEFTKTEQSSTSFIPVKLDLTLSGISGLKIFQRFNISSDLLPYTYKDNYNFLITGVSHDVNNNQWSTKLSSLIALKEQPINESLSFYIDLGLITTPEENEASQGSYTAKKPGGGSTFGISKSQMDYAIKRTSNIDSKILEEQNKFPSKISGYIVTSGIFRNSNGDYHGGFDLSTPTGTKITFKKDVIFRGNRENPGGYGHYVLLEYNGKGIVLGHLSEQYKGKSKIGETIKAGELIGKTGNSGRSSGPHLHFHVYNSISLADKHVLPLSYALNLLTLKA